MSSLHLVLYLHIHIYACLIEQHRKLGVGNLLVETFNVTYNLPVFITVVEENVPKIHYHKDYDQVGHFTEFRRFVQLYTFSMNSSVVITST